MAGKFVLQERKIIYAIERLPLLWNVQSIPEKKQPLTIQSKRALHSGSKRYEGCKSIQGFSRLNPYSGHTMIKDKKKQKTARKSACFAIQNLPCCVVFFHPSFRSFMAKGHIPPKNLPKLEKLMVPSGKRLHNGKIHHV